jgi:dethiobiotin synthetase
MPQPIFITGIGTGVGKTLISAIITEALQADYWKPIQAGYDDGTDSEFVKSLLSNTQSTIFPETYKLSLPASPHIAAREENVRISLDKLVANFHHIQQTSKADYLVIEGAGGLLVPLNDNDFVVDLVRRLDACAVIVSRNYLGSINHSLLTSQACKQNNLKVLGWVFNDQYLNYQQEIVDWSGYPQLCSVPFITDISKDGILQHSTLVKQNIINRMNSYNEQATTKENI